MAEAQQEDLLEEILRGKIAKRRVQEQGGQALRSQLERFQELAKAHGLSQKRVRELTKAHGRSQERFRELTRFQAQVVRLSFSHGVQTIYAPSWSDHPPKDSRFQVRFVDFCSPEFSKEQFEKIVASQGHEENGADRPGRGSCGR